MTHLIPRFMSKTNPTGAEPLPNSGLINETQNLTIPVQPGRTYLFRVVNIGAFAAQYLWVEGHKMRIVEVDGVYTKPAEADAVYIAAAQRVSFLLDTRNDTGANFPLVASMDTVRDAAFALPPPPTSAPINASMRRGQVPLLHLLRASRGAC